eukprot:2111112-Rhodomonas_salina.2
MHVLLSMTKVRFNEQDVSPCRPPAVPSALVSLVSVLLPFLDCLCCLRHKQSVPSVRFKLHVSKFLGCPQAGAEDGWTVAVCIRKAGRRVRRVRLGA